MRWPSLQQRVALFVLFAATLLIRTGFGAVLPVLPIYVAEHGASPLIIAGMTNLYLASHALLQGPAGHLSDRFGRRPVLLAGAALYALVSGLYLLRAGPVLFTLLRLLEGVAASAITPVVRAAVTDLVSAPSRGKAFGGLAAVDNAGFLLGPLLGGLAQSVGGLRAPFLAGAVLSLMAVLALLWLPRQSVPAGDGAPAERPDGALAAASVPPSPIRRPPFLRTLPGSDLGRILRSGAFWAAALPGISFAYLSGLYSVIWSLYLQEVGATPWQISLSFTMYSLPVLLLMLPAGSLTDRVGRPKMVLAGGLFAAIVTMGYGFFYTPWPLLILSGLDGVAAAIFTPASQAFIADVTPSNMRGRFLGLVGSAATLATMAAVTVVGALYQRVPTWVLFAVGTLMLGVGTLISVWLMLRRPTDALREALENG